MPNSTHSAASSSTGRRIAQLPSPNPQPRVAPRAEWIVTTGVSGTVLAEDAAVLDGADAEGWTALMHAVEGGHDEIVEALLRPRGPTAVVGGADSLVIYCEWGGPDEHQAVARELASRFRIHFGAFSFNRVDALPLTGSGKIDYRRLQ